MWVTRSAWSVRPLIRPSGTFSPWGRRGGRARRSASGQKEAGS
ncbi:unnamed protein product [Ciceribacter selenitireducens ATCC BAA-1503]|uniref:Uncharacterized protein n=1 Tax=Ciceribacter selenitireducens ATCC BAA-1503 TaxID=1336235 RepID=A0A376AC70_9HYPH|nr:unnamed protein product [Ciceribacter selenitireducens ATCC BAA-1503]